MLSKTDRDAAGVPRIELHWTKDELDHRTMLEGLRMFGETIAAQDIGRLHISDWVRDGSPYPDGMELAGNHHMGGTRMGTDPADSVVDADCKVTAWRICSSAVVGVRDRRPVHADDDDHRARPAARRPSEPHGVVLNAAATASPDMFSSMRENTRLDSAIESIV